MTTKHLLTSIILLACGSALQAQTTEQTWGGSPILQTFGNFHAELGDDQENLGFNLGRCYLGYEQQLGDGLSIKGVVDVGTSAAVADLQRVAYLKNALLTWKREKFKVSCGLIPTTQFNLQEKAWGHRYIYKSFQDQYKFGSSSDLGLSATYSPTPWLSADAIVVNGEGYKRVQVGDGLCYGLGLTLKPLRGLTLRLYGGMDEGGGAGQVGRKNVAAFVGYRTSMFSLGAEYNYMEAERTWEGFSVYASGRVSRRLELLARYDGIGGEDGIRERVLIVAAEVNVGKHIKLAPTFVLRMEEGETKWGHSMAYMNCSLAY